MTIESVPDFLALLRQLQLLEPAQMVEVTQKLSRVGFPRALAKELVRRGWLSVYQVNQLFSEQQGRNLLQGPYRILDRLGSGGLSQVYKAWHMQQKRLVALKVIHPELLSNPEAVEQFQIEVRASTQLSHPNIVQALDADVVVGDTHYFAMEFVDGTDLEKLVSLSGPLSVVQASDCIRQAALGLQHAYERGLVHRDIKPGNLMLTREGGIVKILDMGLARLEWFRKDDLSSSSLIRQKAAMMGSPDYLSPEQAIEPDKADIRADIYSLGCTYYFLLTGQVPHPGGSLAQKLLAHQRNEPTPVEQLRRDLPVALPPVVRKMMAKKPEDRYRTPAAVAVAVAPFCRGTPQAPPPRRPSPMP
jgi:serine/threonine protein kinase